MNVFQRTIRHAAASFVSIVIWGLLSSTPALAQAETGPTSGEVFRSVGIAVAAVAIVALVLTEFVFRHRISRSAYRVSLIVLLLGAPTVVLMSGMETVFYVTKTVESCNSCHVMEPFVDDLRAQHSATLAAQHFRNRWIPSDQCYQCHTTYGVHGTLAAKRDGFRHWLLYVTRTWDEPIQYSGSYPNVNCLHCHGETDIFRTQEAHDAVRQQLMSDEISCASCHGPPHPPPIQRKLITTLPRAAAHE